MSTSTVLLHVSESKLLVLPESPEVEAPSLPGKAIPRNYPGVPQAEGSIELERIHRAVVRTSNGGLGSSRSHLHQNEDDNGAEVIQGVWDPYMNRFRFLSACLLNFGNGMNDSAPGALIPFMEKHYDIGYAVVSLIFVGNAIGFIAAALFLDDLRHRLGRAKTIAVAQAFMLAGYIPIACTAPFPVVVFSFFLVGFGMSVNLALGNIFCGSLRNATKVLGAMHGAYGIGGTIGPLIATSLAAQAGLVWSRYYLITAGVVVLNAALGTWAYRHYEDELGPSHPMVNPYGPSVPSSTMSRISGMCQVLPTRVVLLGAIFIFAYQGAEVSISGWVTSFLIKERGGDPSSIGYVTAGFWVGITIGRFALTAPAQRWGEKGFVYGVVAGAAAFELVVWLVPNVIGDAVAVAIVGLLLGPVFPCAAAVFMRNMSRSEKLVGMGIISAFGSSGGAAAPFTTGIMAQAVGTFVLHPISIVLFGVMLVCWYMLPSTRNRVD